MKQKPSRPNWWVLYLGIMPLLALFWLEVKAPFSKASHTWAESGLLLLLFGLVIAWLRLNEQAIMLEDQRKHAAQEEPVVPQKKAGQQGIIDRRNGRGHPDKTIFRLGHQLIPAWLTALLSMISNIFNSLD